MTIETNNYQPDPLLSRFRTTLRNELHDWLRRLVMYSAYYVSIYTLLRAIPENIFSLIPYFDILILALASIPMLLPVATWSYWHMGFKSRIRLYFVSVAFLVAYYLKDLLESRDSYATLMIFWYVAVFISVSFLLRRLISRNRHRPDGLAIFLTIILTILIYVSFWIYMMGVPLYVVIENQWPTVPAKAFLDILTAVIIVTISIIPGLQYLEQRDWIKRMEAMDRSQSWAPTLQKILRLAAILFVILYFFWLTDSFLSQACISLGVLFLAAKPGLLLSRQKAHLRNLWKHLGFNDFYTPLSADPLSTNWARAQAERIKRFLEQNTQNAILVSILIVGCLLIPYLGLRYELADSLTELTGVAITTSLSLTMVFITFWFVNNRKKHIVLPFAVADGQQEPHLQALANLMTHAFVKQLRHMALLLSMRQVESIASRNDTALPVFVTSGQEQELIEQVRSLGDIDISNKKIPFGGLLAYIGNSLAHTKVRGTIVRQKDNSVSLLIEFSQRGGQVVAVDMAFVPETSATNLDQSELDNIAKTLAVKLIIQMGKHSHLATSWESLLHFLDGLNAAYHRNWWYALSSYRKAIQYEEANGGSSGTVYYHLGASMVFQGEMSKGLEHLEIAEMHGVPKAETQYMMALAQFHINRDYLHFDRITFEDIRWRCQIALKSRPNFPEAHHLLGTVYYQRGKLLERAFTRRPKDDDEHYSKIDVLPQDYSDDYKKATYHFSRAIRGYSKAIRFLPKDAVSEATFIDERMRLIQYKMSATHRLGDALRSQERYSEGDTYYQETLTAFPANIRTLVDIAKTYCLSGNWQQADQFIRKDIFNHKENRSNKSACFYMGWAYAGGLANEMSWSSQVSDVLLALYERLSIWRRSDKLGNGIKFLQSSSTSREREGATANTKKQQEKKNTLGKALLFLDFAIHQYPRYIHRWKQTDWYDDFYQVALSLGCKKKYEPAFFRKKCYQSEFDSESEYYVDQLYLWICWRIASFLPKDDKKIDSFARTAIGWPDACEVPFDAFSEIYASLLEHREESVNIMRFSDKQRKACSVELHRKKIELCKQMLTTWDKAVKVLKREHFTSEKAENRVSFAERWAIDIFAELAVLTSRMLTESEAFEIVEIVAQESDDLLRNWLTHWKASMSQKFFISPKVLNCQIASLNAWLGYAKYQCSQDSRAIFRKRPSNSGYLDDGKLVDAKKAVDKASIFMPANPLALYTNALILNKQGYGAKASGELNRLLSQVSPFDPHTYQKTNNFIDESDQTSQNILREKSDDIHTRLYYGERIWGRLQFFNIMSTSQIHLQLSKITQELGDLNASTGHMVLAISETPYHDEQANYLMSLVEIFSRRNLYFDAFAVVSETNFRRDHLFPLNIPSARTLQVWVMECILKTGMEDYRASLQRCLEIARLYENKNLGQEHEKIVDGFMKMCGSNISIASCLNIYKERILQPLMNIECSETFDGVIAAEMKFKKLIKALQQFKISEIITTCKTDHYHSDFTNDLDWIFANQMLSILYQDVVSYIIQQCEWLNNCAFNYVELGFQFDKAEKYVQTAINLFAEMETVETSLTHLQFKERLCQYFDTLGWLYYRKGSKVYLDKAYRVLSEQGLVYNQESPIIYYHLARVRLTQIEQTWQKFSPVNHRSPKIKDEDLHTMSQYLRDAFIYWRHAHRFDVSKSLYSRLRLVRLRLDEYRNNWIGYLNPLGKRDADNVTAEKSEKM